MKFVYFQRFDEFFPQFQFFQSNQKFVYFQRFDEFFPQFQFFQSDQKFVYFQRFDKLFHSISYLRKKRVDVTVTTILSNERLCRTTLYFVDNFNDVEL